MIAWLQQLKFYEKLFVTRLMQLESSEGFNYRAETDNTFQ